MLILDFKTLPDAAAGKRLLALERFGAAETLLAMRTLRVASQGDATVPPHLCRIAVVSLVQLDAQALRVLTFDTQTDEAKALRALESAVATSGENPWVWHDASGLRTLLLARALAHGLALPALLAGGLRCVTTQHGLDAAPLHEIAAVHGLPHRLGLQPDEAEALDSLAPQRLTACSEADALMAALLDLGLRQARGETSFDEATACRRRVAAWLAAQTAGHWQQFQQYWAV